MSKCTGLLAAKVTNKPVHHLNPTAHNYSDPLFSESVIMEPTPVHCRCHFSLLWQGYIFQNEFFEFFKSGAVHDIANMFLMLNRIRINIFFNIGICVFHHFQNAFFIAPFDEILSQAGIPFPCTAKQDDPEIMFLRTGPCTGRTISDTDTAAYAFLWIADHFALDK